MNIRTIAYMASSAMLVAVPTQLMAEGCASDLYIGSYQEDASSNPEDPMPGAIHVSIPRDDGNFSGELFFTYIGCQTKNVGSVTGTKKTNENSTSLVGMWQGTVDNRAQEGEFTGALNREGNFTGSYTVAGGKQFVKIKDCIEYYIAPKGTWFLHPTTTSPSDESYISYEEDAISWKPVASSHLTQCQLIDRGEDPCVDEPKVVWQDITLSRVKTLKVRNVTMKNNHSYLASCSQFNKKRGVADFSQIQFSYPLAAKPDPTVTK